MFWIAKDKYFEEVFNSDYDSLLSIKVLQLLLLLLMKEKYCDNRPPSGWLRGAKPLGPFLGPLTSFPSV